MTKVGNHIKHHVCQNCKTSLPNLEEYCPNCGQLNHDLKLPINHLFLEILESIFHFETSFWKTIKNLIIFPGKITKEFNQGKRASYMNPFRMYVFVSLIFFLLLGKLTNSSKTAQIAEKLETLNDFKLEKAEYDSLKRVTNNFNTTTMDSLSIVADESNERIMDSIYKLDSNVFDVLRIQKKIIKFKFAIDDTIGLNARINNIKAKSPEFNVKLEKMSDDEIGKLAAQIISDSDIDGASVFIEPIDTMPPFTYEDMIKIHGYTSEQFDSLFEKRPKLNTEKKGTIQYRLSSFSLKTKSKQVFYNDGNYMMNSVYKSISLSMFFIMPLFGLMLKMFYWRRKIFYYETLIFSIHFHTFCFIVFSLFFLLNIIFINNFDPRMYLIPVGLMLINLFLSLKFVFKQGFIKSLIKEILIIFSYAIVLSIIFTIIGLISYI